MTDSPTLIAVKYMMMVPLSAYPWECPIYLTNISSVNVCLKTQISLSEPSILWPEQNKTFTNFSGYDIIESKGETKCIPLLRMVNLSPGIMVR